MIAAGLGIRPGCDADELVTLVLRAAGEARPPSLLAVPWFRADHPGLRQAARHLALPVVIVAEEALRAVQDCCPTRSARAAASVGFASVAEGCALAAGGAGARLLLPRIASGSASCAVASAEGVPA